MCARGVKSEKRGCPCWRSAVVPPECARCNGNRKTIPRFYAIAPISSSSCSQRAWYRACCSASSGRARSALSTSSTSSLAAKGPRGRPTRPRTRNTCTADERARRAHLGRAQHRGRQPRVALAQHERLQRGKAVRDHGRVARRRFAQPQVLEARQRLQVAREDGRVEVARLRRVDRQAPQAGPRAQGAHVLEGPSDHLELLERRQRRQDGRHVERALVQAERRRDRRARARCRRRRHRHRQQQHFCSGALPRDGSLRTIHFTIIIIIITPTNP